MEHAEMVALIRDAGVGGGETWADLGAGTGNFSRALAELIGPGGAVYAVDRNARALAAQRARGEPPGGAQLVLRQGDVMQPLALPPLDGALLANLLHFIRDQEGLLWRVAGYLRPGGRLVLVEYDQALPIPWVPFPVPPARFEELARAAGFEEVRRVGYRRSPSSGQGMYASVATRAENLPLMNAGASQR
jgi:ubiquinone/menaquinone biosynthesis C-methylase UbiE